MPAGRRRSPAARSPPRGAYVGAASRPRPGTTTMPSRSSTSSIGTTASAPVGDDAAGRDRHRLARPRAPRRQAARRRCARRPGASPGASAARSAKPSIAEAGNGGRSTAASARRRRARARRPRRAARPLPRAASTRSSTSSSASSIDSSSSRHGASRARRPAAPVPDAAPACEGAVPRVGVRPRRCTFGVEGCGVGLSSSSSVVVVVGVRRLDRRDSRSSPCASSENVG